MARGLSEAEGASEAEARAGVDPGICVTSFHQNKFVQK